MKNERGDHKKSINEFMESKKKVPILDKGCEYISAGEYAEFTGKHPVTINKWLNSGKIEGAVKIGGEWRIPVKKPACGREQDIVALIQRQAEQTEAITREFSALAEAVRYVALCVSDKKTDKKITGK